ncbi:flavin reductase family protein [Tessaracoccus sp. ZS01]|uniref:flavin reductase family protein n=1 Tax=Tessaracoccus sp. ZS01 TaxID=1906324 RepID=UPI00117CCDD9|nr:flavin reductase family protein [Tessaracoccus sp. ZS01]
MRELEVRFREAMARVPAPVTIITTTVDGTPTGTTVSAFASLSVDPPMVFFALDNRGGMIERIRAAGRVGVNVLAGDQADVGVRFARRGAADRFADLSWREDHGLPRIDGAVSWLRCDHLQFVPGGDHTVVLASVADAETFGDSSLGYHLREFKDVRPRAAGRSR